jgi:hypothetical protein
MAKNTLKRYGIDAALLLQYFVVLLHVGNRRDVIHTIDSKEPEEKVELSI